MKLLTATIGSHMHVMQRPDSDIDIREVVASPLKDFLDPFTEQKIRTHTSDGDDHVIYELQSFLRLLGKGSPSIIDMLYSPIITFYNDWGHDIYINRRKFINAESARKNCIGYCKGMLHNAEKGERPEKSLRSAVFTTDVVLSFLRNHDYDPMKWDSRAIVKEITGTRHELPILGDLVFNGMYALEQEDFTNDFNIEYIREFTETVYRNAV